MTEAAAISLDELMPEMRAGRMKLVDVLSAESYAAMHIPGSISLPVAAIGEHARAVLPDRDEPITVYCGGPT